MTESIGRMDEGYFVPRGEILRWINQVLKLDLSMIEQLGTGAVYCQLLDAVCPGLVPLHKINWKARTEYEFMENLKVLQFVFDRVGMTKKLDITKLAKSKYQDNLEFIQWMKRFLETQGGCKPDYDPVARRGNIQIDLSLPDKKVPNNKENLKKTTSTANLQKSPIDFRKSCMQLIVESSGLKTPSSRKSLFHSNSGSKPFNTKQKQSETKKTTPNRLKPEQQIQQIKKILQLNTNTETQVQRIKELLTMNRIEQEQDQQII